MHELSTSAQAFLRSNQKPIISGKFGNKSGDNSPSYPKFILNFLTIRDQIIQDTLTMVISNGKMTLEWSFR